MATRFYKGNKPLLSQPSIGGGLMGKAYIGGTRVYGEEPWTPSQLPNLYDYWEADSGVTGTTNVSQWSGKANSNNFAYGGNSQGPQLVSSDSGFNNQSILRFDGTNTEGLYFTLDGDTIGTSTQVNFSMYADPEAINASSTWRMFWGISRSGDGGSDEIEAMGGSKDGAFKFYSYDGGGKTTTLGQTTTPKQLMTMAVDYANGEIRVYFGTSEDSASPISEGSLDTRTGSQTYALFIYNPETNPPQLPGSGDLGGVAIWTGDDEFTTNLSNLETYFQGKYGA